MRGDARVEAAKLGQNNTRMDWPHTMLELREASESRTTHLLLCGTGEGRGNYALLQDKRVRRSVEMQVRCALLER